MKPLVVARRYARALAEGIAPEDEASLEEVAASLTLVGDVLKSDPRLVRFFDDPAVPRPQKDAVVATIVKKARTGDLVRRFLGVLVENRRLGALPSIAEAFRAIKDQRLGIVPAEATLAAPISSAEQKQFRAALEKMTGRTVRLTVSIDPAVLGGARTRIGSRVYDGTLKRQLGILRKRLAEAR